MKTYSIGVDLGGTNLRIASFSSDWQRLQSIVMDTRVAAGPEAVVEDICRAVRTVMQKTDSGLTLQGVAVGSPGPLELPRGRLFHLPNFPGWDGFELKGALEAGLGHSVIVECDANAAAYAEWKLGAGKQEGAASLCMLTLGTGVGNGIILNGKIWHGMSGMGGEAGHVSLAPDGPLCGCGGQGCLELYASATGVRRRAHEMAAAGEAPGIAALIAKQPGVDTVDFAALASAGDAGAIELFRELGWYLGLGLAGLVNTLNLPLYVVGGGVASAWELFAPEMFATLRHYSYVYRFSDPQGEGDSERARTKVVPALLGTHSGLLGAAMLPYTVACEGNSEGQQPKSGMTEVRSIPARA